MNITGINHIGIASKDPQKTRDFFSNILCLPFIGDELVITQKTLTSMFDSHNQKPSSNEARLEILQNQQGEVGPIAKFVEAKGGGIHHVALNVESIETALLELKAKGVELIDEVPRSGAHNTLIAFIHPRSTGGVLLELVEERLKT